MALTRYDEVQDSDVRDEIDRLTARYDDRTDYFVDHLARGIGTVAAARYPDPVIVRTSDFKTNEYRDGFSIGTNDLTQLTLGVGRDSDRLQDLFDKRQASVKRLIRQLIDDAHQADRPVGICGQAPSDHPEFAAFLVDAGIDSLSVNPDSVLEVIEQVAKAES